MVRIIRKLETFLYQLFPPDPCPQFFRRDALLQDLPVFAKGGVVDAHITRVGRPDLFVILVMALVITKFLVASPAKLFPTCSAGPGVIICLHMAI